MHVGSLMLFDLPEGYQGDYYDDVKAQLAKRLHLARLFRRKLAPMPFELADPVWIDDDDIDLDYHVRSVTLRRPGTMAQLEVLVARLHSSLLDRSRPLWEVYVIDGLANGQVAFYSKAHHSGVDGKAGIEIAKVLYDVTPQAREVRPPRPARAGQRLPARRGRAAAGRHLELGGAVREARQDAAAGGQGDRRHREAVHQHAPEGATQAQPRLEDRRRRRSSTRRSPTSVRSAACRCRWPSSRRSASRWAARSTTW